ncbi:MAG: hypothetical protein J5654_08015, partial [Victivallales bacterium]|nr:hypothetical protein [Victivallales bacterium]
TNMPSIPTHYQDLIPPDRIWLQFIGKFFQGRLLYVPFENGIVDTNRLADANLLRCPSRPTDKYPDFSRDFILQKHERRLLTAAKQWRTGVFSEILVQQGRPTNFMMQRR